MHPVRFIHREGFFQITFIAKNFETFKIPKTYPAHVIQNGDNGEDTNNQAHTHHGHYYSLGRLLLLPPCPI